KSDTITPENEFTQKTLYINLGKQKIITCEGSPGTEVENYRQENLLNYISQSGESKTIQGKLYLKYR
ncbi:MAG: hypothetical protein QF864_11515, partial [SAR202 cluster bacterium]|nr:hypothetical protein [SAR202 cluster bacterium]